MITPTFRRTLATLAGAAVVVGAALAARPAAAGGMTLHTRGVRPTARGGAFVAGADDPGALWFNPAGLAALAGGRHDTGVLADAALVSQSGEYDRIDSGNNDAGAAENQFGGLPIPSIAAAFDLGDDGVLAAGIYAPYAGLMKFDEDGPQRYSLIDMSHTLIATMSVGIGWKLGNLRIGATVQNWVAGLNQTIVVSGCPGETICAPEDPEFDAVTQLESLDLFNPSGSLGVQYDVGKKVTLGAAFQAPVQVKGGATLRTRLPSSGFYDGAVVVGEDADVELWLPATVRAGVELRPDERWRVETAVDVELWSMHEEITITPRGMRIENAAGVGTYELGPLVLPRNYEDTIAVSLGVEGQPAASQPLRVMAGYTYETAAAPDAYLSVLTFDGAKHVVAGGLGYAFGEVVIDAVFGYGLVEEREVTRDEARSPLLSPVRDPNDPPLETYVNAGTYRSTWLIAGLGIRTGF